MKAVVDPEPLDEGLDLMGDLYLLGHSLRGRVIANMTSHGLNHAMALRIHQSLNTP